MTEDKKREDIMNNIETSMFVEAGAGAGKTTLLLERILNQLKSGIDPEAIVAITFTKKAAEEMRTRMFTALNKSFIEEKDDTKKSNIHNAIVNYEKIQISTIHSFCYKLLMEQALNAKLRMDLSMLENDDERNNKMEFFNNKWRSIDYKSIIKIYELKINKLKDLSFSVFSILTDLPEEINVVKDAKLLESGIENYPKKDKDKKIINDSRDNEKEVLYPEREAFIANYLIDFIEPFAKEYREIKDSHYISNNLLLIKVRDLLNGKEEYSKNALKYFRKKYKYFYVDEFQDTDRVQVDLIYSLAKDEKEKLREGSLFIVGDPKQSIYRFRGADVPLYLKVKKEFENMEKEGEKVKVYTLNYNYRSNKEIVDFVNENNKNIFDNYGEMESKSSANIFYNNNSNAVALKGVYHIGHPDKVPKNGSNWLYKKEYEEKDLPRLIKTLVDNNFKIYDRKKEKLKEVEYRDFLILCRSTKDMDKYMKVLMENDIPVNISSKINISDNKILFRIRNIYRYIAYPYGDKLATVGISQVFAKGLVNDTNKDDLKEKVKKFFEKVKSMDAYTALTYVAHNLDLYIYNQDELDASKLKRIQTQITQMLETVINQYDNNKMEVYDGICKFIENGYERELSQEYENNAVRFMNVHKAKGLEGKIVIICKRSDQRPYYNKANKPVYFNYDTYHEDNEYYISASRLINYKNEYLASYANNNDIIKKVETEEIAEYDRLAYVAVTRAEEVLIVMNVLTDKQELLNKYIDSIKMKENLLDIECENGKMTIGDYIKDDSKFVPQSNSTESSEWEKNEFELEKDNSQKEKIYNKISPSLLAKEDKVIYTENSEEDGNVINSMSIEQDNDNEDSEITIVKDNIEIKGAVYGTIMHRVFELIVNSYIINKKILDAKSKEIETIINLAIIESYDTISKFKMFESKEQKIDDYIGKLKDVLKEDIEKFIKSDLMTKTIPNAKQIFTELSFEYVDEENGIYNNKNFNKELKSLVNGRADLVIINKDDSVLIVDYKSNINKNVDKEKFKAHLDNEYKAQLDFYKRVLNKVYQKDESKIETQIYNKFI